MQTPSLREMLTASSKLAEAVLTEKTPFSKYLDTHLAGDVQAMKEKNLLHPSLSEEELLVTIARIRRVFSTGGIVTPPSHSLSAKASLIRVRSSVVSYFREIGFVSRQYHCTDRKYGLSERDLFVVPALYEMTQESRTQTYLEAFMVPEATLITKYDGFLANPAPVDAVLRSSLEGALVEGVVSYGDVIRIAQGL